MVEAAFSVKDLFHLAFSEPVTWYSQAGWADQNVRWVTRALASASPSDLLLLSAMEASSEYLAQASQKKVAAVLIVEETTQAKQRFSGGALRHGILDQPGMAVAVITTEMGERQVERQLLTVLINQRAAYIERGQHIHSRLAQLAIEGAGLGGLARAMADISGEGILIQDKRLNVLAEAPSPALLSTWDNILKQLSARDSLPELFRDRKQAGKHPLPSSHPLPGGLERLVIPITVSEMARGYLSLIGLAGTMDVLDQLVAEHGAPVCAIEMARHKAVREAEKRLKGDMITALLQESISASDARLWAQAMGVDLDRAYAALRFTWEGSAPPSRRRLETLIYGESAGPERRVVVSPLGFEVLCFFQVASAAERPEAALAFGQAVLEQGRQEYPDHPIRCGVGTPAQELGAWRVSFRQAGQALEMARRLNEGKPLYFSDLSVYRLLLQIEHHSELAIFHEEILGALLAHENGRELIHTLEAYFEHNGNLAQAAEALYVHRNTLIYRMDRIAAISGLNLLDHETRLAVQLALHINRMMNAKTGGNC